MPTKKFMFEFLKNCWFDCLLVYYGHSTIEFSQCFQIEKMNQHRYKCMIISVKQMYYLQ